MGLPTGCRHLPAHRPRVRAACTAPCLDRGAARGSAGGGRCGPGKPHRHARRAPGFSITDRKSVVEGKSVDLGGRRIIKKKKTKKESHIQPQYRYTGTLSLPCIWGRTY